MGKFILIFLFSIGAYAQDVNLLKNNAFESRLSRWVKTGSSTLAVQSASPLEGDYSADWDASATGEFLRSNLYVVSDGLKGRRCTIEMDYLWDSGTLGHIKMNVDDGTNDLLAMDVSPTSGGISQKISQTFECPSSGSIRFELESTADAASIRVDKMYLGSSKNTVQLSQANFFGSARWEGVTNCEWNVTNTAYTQLSTDVDCNNPIVGGEITAPSTKIQAINATWKPGHYKFLLNAPFFNVDITTANWGCRLDAGGVKSTIFDGITRNAGSDGYDLGAWSFDLALSSTYSGEVVLECRKTAGQFRLPLSNVGMGANWLVYRYPLNSAEALTIDTSGWIAEGTIGGANEALAASATSPTPLEVEGLTLVNSSNATAQSKIACADTFSSVGANCPSSAEQVGFSFTPLTSGLTEVCISGPMTSQVGAAVGAVQEMYFRTVRTNSNSTTVLETGHQVAHNLHQGANGAGNGGGSNVESCGLFNLTAGTEYTFRQYYTASNSVGAGGTYLIDRATGNKYNREAYFRARPYNQSFPAPVFTEVKNKMNAGESGVSTATAIITLPGGVPTLSQQTGNWVSSLVDNGTGDTTININSGIFSLPPVCTCNARLVGFGICTIDTSTAPSSTLVRIQTSDGGGPTVQDYAFNIICVGK